MRPASQAACRVQYLRVGSISAGHAKVILGVEQRSRPTNGRGTDRHARLSVRQTEEFVDRPKASRDPARAQNVTPPPNRDLHIVDLENKLKQRFSTVESALSVRERFVEIRFQRRRTGTNSGSGRNLSGLNFGPACCFFVRCFSSLKPPARTSQLKLYRPMVCR
jgi:hypothetical protein